MRHTANMEKNRMSLTHELPVPQFYNPDNASRWDYNPDLDVLALAAFEWAEKYRIKPSSTDTFNLHVLGIDFQKDFCFPDGTLYVAGLSGTGAIDDSKRFSEFIYRNLSVITNITTTMDTHFALQIFFPYFWLGDDNKPLRPHTLIVFDTVNGKKKLVNKGLDGTVLNRNVRPNPALASWMSGGNYMWLTKQVEYYVDELEKAGKYQLYLWPPHCIFGGAGHALVGVIHEARMFQSYARMMQNHPKIKGTNPLTEHYGALEAEVLGRWDGKPLDQIDTEFLNILFEADALAVAGQ
ncbi:MAG: nicotinamidase, partial [Parcubacteria group bacterium]|nr:nicotinamidase [Parcubacteria group bacterium]